MAEIFKIRGGRPLAGEVEVRGSKNSSLALIAATVLSSGTCVLRNVPRIRDGENLLEILRGLGSDISWQGDALSISNENLSGYEPDPALVRRLRGSVLLAGALLARFGKVVMPFPGGDQIGARPLDVHLQAFRQLGAAVEETPEHFLHISAPRGLKGGSMVLAEPSVTATENAILAASLADGETTIKIAATEPHVQDLIHFLNSIGAHIEGGGTHTLHIRGTARKLLGGGARAVISDADEAMSFAVLAAATRSDVMIKNCQPDHIELALAKLVDMGAHIETGDGWVRVGKPSGIYRAAKIKVGPYPQLMSDQLPPFAVLATQASGTSLIHEWMYEGRLGYVNELIKMGANAVLMDPHRALIVGPTPLRGTELQSLDIRAGMTILIAGLVAEGETTIQDAATIDRGYERIEERLRALGADIERQAF